MTRVSSKGAMTGVSSKGAMVWVLVKPMADGNTSKTKAHMSS